MQGQTIILDTNIWVSYIIKRQLDQLVTAKYDYELTFLSCPELVLELTEVLQRPRIRDIIGENHYNRFGDPIIQFHQYHCLNYALPEKLPQIYVRELIPDKKDLFLFDLAATYEAAYLVTGDRALLGIQDRIPHVRIISLSEFKRATKQK